MQLVKDTVTTLASSQLPNAISNTGFVGRQFVIATRWSIQVLLDMHAELQFIDLLHRIYSSRGITHQLSVPQLDLLSDLERDLLLNSNDVSHDHIISFFEASYILSGYFLKSTRLILPQHSDLPQALADLEKLTQNLPGIVPLASVSVLSSNESGAQSVTRFNNLFAHRSHFQGKKGFATKRCQHFPNIDQLVDSSSISSINDCLPVWYTLDLQREFDCSPRDHFLISQQRLLLVAITEDTAEIFFQSSDDKVDVFHINRTGVQASRVDQITSMDNIKLTDWMRYMAILMYVSIQMVTSFPIKEIALTLLESVAVTFQKKTSRDQKLRVLKAKETPSRGLLPNHDGLDQCLSLLQILIHISLALRKAAKSFVQGENENDEENADKRPLFALTYDERRREPPMPLFSYEHRDRVEKQLREELKNIEFQIKSIDSKWGERKETVKNAFETAGTLKVMTEKLKQVMRDAVQKAQISYMKGRNKLPPTQVSGSLWLDRIAKGELLTTERAKELTYHRRRQDVPLELKSKRETGFYLPLYDRTIVLPEFEDLSNIPYKRMQLGSETDLTSAVSVLVAIILWTEAQGEKIVEYAISEDNKGTGKLIQYTEGIIGTAIQDVMVNAYKRYNKKKIETNDNNNDNIQDDKDKGLEITKLIQCVEHRLQGKRDDSWIVREVLSIAAFWGITCTEATEPKAGYIKTIIDLRSVHATTWQLINANVAVSLRNVKIRQFQTHDGRMRFVLLDPTIPSEKLVMIESMKGGPNALSNAMNNPEMSQPIMVNMSITNDNHKKIDWETVGILYRVFVQ